MVTVDDWDNDDDQDKTSILPSETFRGKLEKSRSSPACLVCLVGPAGYVGRQWKIEDDEIIIGRSMDVGVFVDDRSVSKSHAKVMMTTTGDVVIVDLKATNKTIVNEQVIPPLKPFTLTHNDQIKAGNVILKYLAPGSIEAFTNQETYDRSQIDSLTGAYNKNALLLKGPELFKRALVLDEPLCVITFDIDHFKRLNDTHGHDAGDYVLRELSGAVRSKMARANDYFARSGGEEFVIILSSSSLQQAIEVAERIRKLIEGHKFEYNGIKMPITISTGVSSRTLETKSWEDIFKKADMALYMSKNNGRNRTSTL